MINPYQSYQQSSVMTASPQELTLMLYNGCLKFIRLAKKAMAAQKFEEKNTNILKAQKIVQELYVTLNPEIELSSGMGQLYDFIHQRLVDANLQNDLAALEEAEGLMLEFRDAWKQAMELVKR
jgi:flagellar secretion chaperone FliS